jgi:ribosome-binding protein aMBF1 (putative translation factor)
MGSEMTTFNEHLEEMLDDPAFAAEYEALQPEREVMLAITRARAERDMTQAELAERTGIRQSEISRLENGTRNPSIKLLQRLADGLDMRLRISFEPKNAKVR